MSADKMVKKIPITKVTLEISLDGKTAAIVFTTHDGKEHILNTHDDINGGYRNLIVRQI